MLSELSPRRHRTLWCPGRDHPSRLRSGVCDRSPGGTSTDMSAEFGHRYIHPDLHVEQDTALRAMTALGRWAEPSEIAAVVAFLVSVDASYITGRTIPVDGGFV